MIKRLEEKMAKEEEHQKKLYESAPIKEPEKFCCILCNKICFSSPSAIKEHLESSRHRKELKKFYCFTLKKEIRKHKGKSHKDSLLALLKDRGLVNKLRTKYNKLKVLSLKLDLLRLLSSG